MQNTETKSLNTAVTDHLKQTHSMDSGSKSNPPKTEATSVPLSRDLSQHLLSLAKKVTAEEVTPQTVNAACQCAAELYKIMKLNWEMRKNSL